MQRDTWPHSTKFTGEQEKAQWAHQFFSKLLQRLPSEQDENQATNQILSVCKTRVSDSQRETLEKDYTLQELHEAAAELGKNKAPGPDALPVEFFLIFWDTAAPTLLRLAKQGLENSQLPPSFTAGDIVLLPKEGDQTKLQNKRPITLLNAGYKIVAKLLQNRLAPILQEIVSFVWGGANTSPRQRIAHKVLQLPKSSDGLGLLAARHQASVFAAATITWALAPGKKHPLKLLIRAKFVHYAETKWGATMETAILHTRSCKTDACSPTMAFLLTAWAKTATLIKSPGNTDRTAWENTSIWGPKIAAVRTKTITAKPRGHQSLKEVGITQLKHIADSRGRILESHQINSIANLDRRAMTAYQKIRISSWIAKHPQEPQEPPSRIIRSQERQQDTVWRSGQKPHCSQPRRSTPRIYKPPTRFQREVCSRHTTRWNSRREQDGQRQRSFPPQGAKKETEVGWLSYNSDPLVVSGCFFIRRQSNDELTTCGCLEGGTCRPCWMRDYYTCGGWRPAVVAEANSFGHHGLN
ncbi:hypothetical protein R1sor_020520 [Riccia sorocarpa]|uniref:Reverse transcriptase n=1 Tax=Riccia sorocarpa TaxID=122646 RepID=A0ABD3IFP3_9MARC